MNKTKSPRMLIINPFGIGDVTFSTPLLEILKQKFPDSFLGYICNKRVSELIAADPHLDRIFIYEKDEFRDALRRSRIEGLKKILALLMFIKKEKFDISIDLSLNYQYSMFMKFLGVRKRLGFNYRKRGKFLTDKIEIEGFDSKHVIEYYLDVLRLLDIDTRKYDIRPRIYASDADARWADKILKEDGLADKDMMIGVVPGCGASWGADADYRRWDKKNFSLVADMIIDKYGARIILLGNPKEVALCREVEAMMRNKVMNYAGRTSIGGFLGILKRCKAVITNDGGPLHMAAGLGVKTVSVFGPVDEGVYGPYGNSDDHAIISKKDLPCRPCYKKFKYKRCENRLCLDLITAEEVFQAFEKVLSK